MKIIVGGVVSLSPFMPGIVWTFLQMAVGLRKLGHDVYYVEEVDPKWCVDELGRLTDLEHSLNRELFRSTMQRFELMDHACQVFNRGQSTFGMSLSALQ